MNKKKMSYKTKSSSKEKTPRGKKYYESKADRDASKRNYQDAFADEEKAKAYKSISGDKFPTYSASPKNDARWYFKDPKILADVASFSYSTALGTHFANGVLHPERHEDAAYWSIPGLMSMILLPVPGIAVNAASPLNIASENIYSFVRYKNSGAKNYNSPDLMMYFIAMDQVYSCWNWLKRLYGMASTYSQLNKYEPQAWFAANYVDIDDVKANLANFRAFLNIAANRISSFCVPAVFNYMVRHSWLFANVYTDSETNKAQQYMFVPAAFYKFDETSSPHGGILRPINVCAEKPSTFYKTSTLMHMLDSMINALQYSEDIGIMSGDVLKAYGEGGLFTLGTVDADFRIEPVYRREVLSQLENATFTPFRDKFVSANASQLQITQDPNTNFIKFKPSFEMAPGTSWANSSGISLNFHWNNPTPEDVMEASRINISWETVTVGAKTYLELIDCGTEIAIGCEMFLFAIKDKPGTAVTSSDMSNVKLQTVPFTSVGFGATSTLQDVAYEFYKLWVWAAFDWAPEMRFTSHIGSDSSGYLTKPSFRDWDVYTMLTKENLMAINQLALLTMFDVPN